MRRVRKDPAGRRIGDSPPSFEAFGKLRPAAGDGGGFLFVHGNRGRRWAFGVRRWGEERRWAVGDRRWVGGGGGGGVFWRWEFHVRSSHWGRDGSGTRAWRRGPNAERPTPNASPP